MRKAGNVVDHRRHCQRQSEWQLPLALAAQPDTRVSMAALFAVIAAGAARTQLDGSNSTVFSFHGPRFSAASPASTLYVYSQAPSTLALVLTTTLQDCLRGAHLPTFSCALDPTAAGLPTTTIGALFEGWHAPPSYAQALVAAQGGAQLSVEDVLRSGAPGAPPNLTLHDIYARWPNASAATDGFFWQERPALGYYCIYRSREGEAGLIPDCVNISGTLAAQSAWLTGASIDFITLDGTNLCTPSAQEELIQQRPAEVLLEEFLRLRAAGVATPRVAAWQRLVAGCTTYPAVLALYNNASYIAADLFLRAPSGKRVFFVPSDPDPALVAAVEANGGRHDIVTQVMWALFAQQDYSSGEWGFMSPCTSAKGEYTTSVMGLGRGATGCGQNLTLDSALGSALSVSPSYQLSYGSVPFSAAGKFEGLTLQRQFGTLFDAAGAAWGKEGRGEPTATPATASALPQNIYLSSWNEWTAQPQPNPFHSQHSFSMGLGGDADGGSLFVDSYGSALSRDLEPTARPNGDALYKLLASCLRVVRLMESMQAYHHPRGTLASLPPFFGSSGIAASATTSAPPPLSSCAVGGEACCAYNETTQGYALWRSLVRTDGSDALASTDAAEIAALLGTGAWAEVCNGYGGGTDFCVSAGVLQSQRTAGQGPFLLHSGGCGAATQDSGADPAVQLPGRLRVQRCLSPSGQHFLSPLADCGGEGSSEGVVGCADAARSSNMPRVLFSCKGAGSPPRYHALDMPCLPGDTQTQLGYAH